MTSSTPGPLYKTQKSRPQRFLRLLGSFLDPRAWAHGAKILNYYNHTHVAELRRARIGRSVSISPTASFANARNIVLGDRVRIGANSSLWAGPGTARIVLGADTLLAPNVMLTAANYRFNDGSPVNDQAMNEADIIVGEDVWIGYGAVILAGVTIGDRAIIGAGAVVRDDVPRNGILVGGPPTVIGYRREAASGEAPALLPSAGLPPPAPSRPTPPAEPVRPGALPGQARREYSLTMPQMALSGMGEAWLFKEIGDLHQHMITDLLQSSSSAIADEDGARLYATFTRFRLEAAPDLRGFRENDPFTIDSALERFGSSFFFGRHEVASDLARCDIRTMSTFAKYGERGENTSLIKGVPTLPALDVLPSLTELPEFGTEYRTRRGEEAKPGIFTCEYEIQAPHDVNGVGLLYFATYPSIFDICIERHEGNGFLTRHSTVKKDIFYYANSEVTDTLVFRLHERRTEGELVVHSASLFRKSDGVRMGEVFSAKHRLDM